MSVRALACVSLCQDYSEHNNELVRVLISFMILCLCLVEMLKIFVRINICLCYELNFRIMCFT